MPREKPHREKVRALVAAWSVAVLASTGCGTLSDAQIRLGDVDLTPTSDLVVVAIDPDRPAVLRAVDGSLLAEGHVSSRLRALSYVIAPGEHELWLTSAPYGQPLLPQRLKCYVLKASLKAGGRYRLAFDPDRQAPALEAVGTGVQVLGILVDAPFIFERGCTWR